MCNGTKTPLILKYYYMLYIKRTDAKNCACIPISLSSGPCFTTPPNLPHGINGIIIHPSVMVGSNVTILHQVTLGTRHINKGPKIGNNVFIGAGAKILGDIIVGDNAKIGANAVVLTDVPANCTAVGNPARIIHLLQQENL